jgi:DNA-binding CsgD family transcriptional regulator
VAEQLGLEQLTSALLYGCGLAALYRGRPEEARRLAQRGIELSGSVGDEVYTTSNEALIGFVELVSGDYDLAGTRLAALWPRMASLGRRANAQGVLANAVEALLAAGRIDEARSALATLELDAATPAAGALVARSRGALAAAEGELDPARAALDEALHLHEQAPVPVERGRTLVVLGGVLRRLKQRRAARDVLLEAVELFDVLGAPLWAEQARAELARVSGRAPGSDELTENELLVARLVVEGKTNKEVAAALFLSVRGVESTLSKVYRKLGARSRTELAGLLRDRP